MRYLIFKLSMKVAKWACIYGDTYDLLMNAEAREKEYEHDR